MRRTLVCALLSAVAFSAGACRDANQPVAPAEADPVIQAMEDGGVDRVSIIAGDFVLYVGQSTSFWAQAYDANNNVVSCFFFWTSDNPTVLQSQGGSSFKGVAPGYAGVTASCDGKSDTRTVTVLAAATPTSVAISPDPVGLTYGESKTLSATLYSQYNSVLTPSGPYTWSVDDPSVATVTSSGQITAVGVGSTTVRASVDGVSGSASVTSRIPVTVSGPEFVFAAGTYQWTATRSSGPSGTYSYEWQIRPHVASGWGANSWTPIDTGSTLSHYVAGCDVDFDLRAVVYYNGQTAGSGEIFVDNFSPCF